jgi:hypothetical protein
MILYVVSNLSEELRQAMKPSHGGGGKTMRHRLTHRYNRIGSQPLKRRSSLVALVIAAVALGGAQALAPPAHAAPAPEVEYVYNVAVRRHYNFPNNDALGYGHGICDNVTRGKGYAQVMSDAKTDVTPNDGVAANYLVSYAVNLLCPAQIWQLRNSAADYQPPVT